MTLPDSMFMGEQSHTIALAVRGLDAEINTIWKEVDSSGGLLAAQVEVPRLLKCLIHLHNLLYYIEAHRADRI